VELRGRLEGVSAGDPHSASGLALKALVGLGYSRVEARRLLKQVGDPSGRDVEALVREALAGVQAQ